jgi:4-carboxymuconolactone decarboxylase
MDTQELHDRGLKLRRELFGAAAVEQRATKSLAMIAMMAAAGKPAELRVHLKGALKNGCKPDEIREILLLVALYCGIPAANEAHRAAVDVLREDGPKTG